MSLKVISIERSSPLYKDVDTKVNLGFGALHIFWKPKTMVNLMNFLVDNGVTKKDRKQSVCVTERMDTFQPSA